MESCNQFIRFNIEIMKNLKMELVTGKVIDKRNIILKKLYKSHSKKNALMRVCF